MAYTIRPAREADLEALIPMFSTYLCGLTEVGMRYTPHCEGVAELLSGRVKSRRALLAVAEEEGDLLGFLCASLSRMSGEYLCEGERAIGYVDDIYVCPQHRGRRIASALADYAEAWMGESGVKAVQLHVLFENPAGTAFWRSRGMEPMAALCYKQLKGAEKTEENQ